MFEKKISFKEYKQVLSLVVNYKKQNESINKPLEYLIPKGRLINLSGKISDSMFMVLANYYQFYYQLEINKSDLSQMHANLLAAIDYKLLQKFRGIGNLGILRLQKIIEHNLEQPD